MMHLFITLVVLYRYITKHRYIKAADDRYTDGEIMITVYYRESFLDMTLVTGLYMMIQWTRMIIVFRVNSFIGPMIKIIENMLFEIIKFIIIYGLILIVFASSGYLFFIRVEGYSTITDAFISLLSASLGSFDFTPFESKDMVLSTSFGYYFLILYLVISNIVLLNFIIAILANTYNKLIGVSKALYFNEIIKIRNVLECDKYYSSLVSLPIPLNAALIPAYPFIIFCKSKRLNNLMLHISYLPVMVLGTLCFCLLSIVLWPISYLALLWQNFIDIWEKGSNGGSRWREFVQFLQMIFKAPFMLVGYMVYNTY